MENVCFSYLGSKKSVLNKINLNFKKNEMVLLLGASGAGKSSLAYCLNGLIPNSIYGDFSGTIRVEGKKTTETPIMEFTKHIGIVFQDPDAQLVTMKVEDEVAFGMENLCLDPIEMNDQIDTALKKTGLSKFRDWPVDLLSGGQKQKLALASILCMRPQILVLDEPTANLDPAGTKEVFSILRELRQSGEYTIIMIEHKLDDVIDLIDRVVVLGKNGSIIADGHPRDVFYKNYQKLLEEGVWLPYCVKLQMELQSRVLPFTSNPLTVKETVAKIKPFLSAVKNPEIMPLKEQNLSRKNIVLEIKKKEFSNKLSKILHPMELSIPEGDFLAIVGKNGSGKSALTRFMMNLEQVEKEIIYLNGKDLVELPMHEIVNEIGYVFQNPEHQFITSCVADELAFGLKCRNVSRTEIVERVQEMLVLFGLEEYANIHPFQLSHGEKRRLSVASMLITGQKLLIFDEPTFGQDQKNARALLQIMKQLQRTGHTIIIISHDMALIAEFAENVAVLKEGQLVFHGTVQALFTKQKLLEENGLSLPPSVELALQFEQLPQNGYSIENLVEALEERVRVVQA
ncbi:ATP-binding cassette domain-containing protein [Bacillus sp. Bva_UNVM-123]